MTAGAAGVTLGPQGLMWLECAGWFFPPSCLLKEAWGLLGFKGGIRSLISVR